VVRLRAASCGCARSRGAFVGCIQGPRVGVYTAAVDATGLALGENYSLMLPLDLLLFSESIPRLVGGFAVFYRRLLCQVDALSEPAGGEVSPTLHSSIVDARAWSGRGLGRGCS